MTKKNGKLPKDKIKNDNHFDFFLSHANNL